MPNPFEDDSARYLVLVNEEQQYSLWPQGTGIPDGWEVVVENETRATCLEYVRENWIDMRPRSLAESGRAR
ncbi:MbtH family protein [Kitasatospora griseola]|uniref:MbtH family protein n=1 Tax=Kitasatospora griseola TaxID=2064 RepID=UPI00365F9499